jgi:hypothetical protein
MFLMDEEPPMTTLTDSELRQAHCDATAAFLDNLRSTPLSPAQQAVEAARDERSAYLRDAWRNPPNYIAESFGVGRPAAAPTPAPRPSAPRGPPLLRQLPLPAQTWSHSRRVVAKVEWHPGELYPRGAFW